MNTTSTIGFTLHGSGPEHVLVLHDWNGDHTNYDPIVPYLDGASFTYAFADLRGYGKSKATTGAYTVQEIASDCLHLVDTLGWQRFHVVGHSMTGVAVERLVADATARIKSAVAVCPMSAAGSPAPPDAIKFFASTTTDDAAFRRLIKFVTGNLSDQWAEAKLIQNRATVSPACREGYLEMFWKANFVDEVKGIATPILVLVGDKDPGIDEAAMKKTFLAWHPNAEVLTIANCGHYPMQECPPFFATVIENFLKKHAD